MAEKKSPIGHSDQPKHRQLIKMLSFRIVPAYFDKIEEAAKENGLEVSALIRKYIKEGLIRDHELKSSEDFRVN